MKVEFEVRVIEGYSDAPTGRLAESIGWTCDLPAIPRKGDYIETGYGDYPVAVVFWRRDGLPLIRLGPIYTLAETMETVLAALREGGQPEVGE